MAKRRDNPQALAGNRVAQAVGDWMATPEDQYEEDISITLGMAMEEVRVDAHRRELIWPEAQYLNLEQSLTRLHEAYPDIGRQDIEYFLITWLENYAPEDYSQAQCEELDRLIDPWTDELEGRFGSG